MHPPDKGTARDTNRHNLLVRVTLSRQRIVDEEQRLARLDADPSAFRPLEHAGLPHSIDRLRVRLYMLERKAVRAGAIPRVEAKLPERLLPWEAADLETLDRLDQLKPKQQKRFDGRRLGSIAEDPLFRTVTWSHVAVRPRMARRESQPGVRRRTNSSSTTSSADPPGSDSDSDQPEPVATGHLCHCCEPPRPVRFCACGCEREITHSRADAKTFGASCRSRIKRDRDGQAPRELRTCQCESGFFYRDVEGDAICGQCGCWLAKITSSIVDAEYRDAEAEMRSNGVYVTRRLVPREWRTRPARRSPVMTKQTEAVACTS